MVDWHAPRASPCPLPCLLLALDAADQTRFVLVSSQGCHLIKVPCVNRRSLPPLGDMAGETLSKRLPLAHWEPPGRLEPCGRVIVLSHAGGHSSQGTLSVCKLSRRREREIDFTIAKCFSGQFFSPSLPRRARCASPSWCLAVPQLPAQLLLRSASLQPMLH